MLYRRGSGLAYLSVLDWAEATRPDALRGEVTAFHEIENWRKVGYFADSITTTDALLERGKPFAVIDAKELHWFEHRVQANPAFTAELLRAVHLPDGSDFRIWTVRPKPVAPASR